MKKSIMYYSDVAKVAEQANIPAFSLWNICPVFHGQDDSEPFTFDVFVLRRLCQYFNTETVKKALGR